MDAQRVFRVWKIIRDTLGEREAVVYLKGFSFLTRWKVKRMIKESA